MGICFSSSNPAKTQNRNSCDTPPAVTEKTQQDMNGHVVHATPNRQQPIEQYKLCNMETQVNISSDDSFLPPYSRSSSHRSMRGSRSYNGLENLNKPNIQASVANFVQNPDESSIHNSAFFTQQSFNSLHSPSTDEDSSGNGTPKSANTIHNVFFRGKMGSKINLPVSQSLPRHPSDNQIYHHPTPTTYDELATPSSSESPIFKFPTEKSSGRHVSMKTTVRASFTADGQKMLNEYVILKKIGRGSYGKVKLVMDKNSKKLYAMKICDRTVLQKMKRDKRGRPIKSTEMDTLKKEVAILKKVEHPHVVKLYEVIDDSDCDKLYMIFEYVERGAVLNLSSTDKECPAFSENVARQYFRDLLMGLQYLHDHKIIHRDIKPENLLVDKNGRLKLTDFGVSIMFYGDDDLLKTSTGTPAFLPPEACKSGRYRGKPFDIWCSGVTLYVLLYGKVPFRGQGIMGTYNAILYEEAELPEDISDDLKDLFSRLLEKRPSKRITLPELLSHRWVTNNGSDPIKNEYHAQQISNDDIENAIAPGETLKLIDKFVLMSKLQNKFVRKLNATREKIKRKKEREGDSEHEAGLPEDATTTPAEASAEPSLIPMKPFAATTTTISSHPHAQAGAVHSHNDQMASHVAKNNTIPPSLLTQDPSHAQATITTISATSPAAHPASDC